MSEHVPDSELVEARLKEVTTRFGDRLSTDQVALVKTRIERTLKLAATMRATPLSNADEPEIVFSPFRGDR